MRRETRMTKRKVNEKVKGGATVNNSGFVKVPKERQRQNAIKSAILNDDLPTDETVAQRIKRKELKNKNRTKAKTVSDDFELDLSVGKLPTDTVHTLSKRSKYSEDAVYPNSSGPSRCIFNGPSGSGKSNFCLSLLTEAKHLAGFFDKVFVFCPSAELQADYAHLESRYKVPQELEIVDFTPAAVQVAWDAAKEIFQKCKESLAPLPQTLFLFDDLINVPGFDKCASTLMTKARHSGISVWVITQGFMTLSRLMRLQASNVFAFSPTESEIERLAKDCTNAIADEKTADRIIREATRERFKPFHFNRHASMATQYRQGLTRVFQLNDPAENKSIHGIKEEDEPETESDEEKNG